MIDNVESPSAIGILTEVEKYYWPNDSVLEKLQTITMGLIIGPVAVGKSTCINELVSLEEERFGRVRSFTTRPRRTQTETQYEFLPQEEATLKKLTQEAQEGELVQFSVHPTTHNVYGSHISTYDKPFMLLDVLSRNVPAMRSLPFKKRYEFTVVASPREWLQRFLARALDNGLELEDALKRVDEGAASLRFSQDQDETMHWVHNVQDRHEDAVYEIRDVMANHYVTHDWQARQTGFRLLEAICSFTLS